MKRGGQSLGSLSKEDGKAAIGSDCQNNNFARASRFFVHSFLLLHDYDVKLLISRFIETGTQGNDFLFYKIRYSPLEFNSSKKKNTDLWQTRRVEIRATSFETARILFLSEVLATALAWSTYSIGDGEHIRQDECKK